MRSLQVRRGLRFPGGFAGGFAFLFLFAFFSQQARASVAEVRSAIDSGQYFTAARIAFFDANQAASDADRAMAYAWTTESLVRAGLEQSAVYFFIRTIQFRDRAASKKVLEFAPLFLDRAGADFLKKFLLKNTRLEDYPGNARSVLHLAVAKDRLLQGNYQGALEAAGNVPPSHALYALALQIRGSAALMLNRPADALVEFEKCEEAAEQRRKSELGILEEWLRRNLPPAVLRPWEDLRKNSSFDLQARCIANQSRVLYETGRFEEADRRYDRIPKSSFVWTDTLFEHAWNSYAREEYNRTLGKLVSYRSPALRFVFNSEVDVLMAQSYSALCLYDDAARIIEEFHRRLGTLARDVREFLERHPDDPRAHFELGRRALKDRLHTDRVLHRFLNRFVRSPHFQSLSLSLDRIEAEKIAIERLDARRSDAKTGSDSGFPGFLNRALDWRLRTIQMLGGIFVRNSMIDHHQVLVSDLEKMQFMKIDVLSRQKERLLAPDRASTSERNRGNRKPERRDDQYLWSFNGEFWNDEIGDYVFALESECGRTEKSGNP